MTETILFLLPESPDVERPETHWWQALDGQIVKSGYGSEWLELVAGSADRAPKLIALAPAAMVRLIHSERPISATTPRQAETAARLAGLDSSLGDRLELHSVSAVADDGATVVTAVVDNVVMDEWLAWTSVLGADPHHVVPIAALLPLHSHWTEATFGCERLIGRHGLVMIFEPELAAQIVGEASIDVASDEAVDAALVAAAATPPIDLRTGNFRRRRRVPLDRVRIRELAILAWLVPMIALAWLLISMAKLQSETNRLDEETVAIAESALGRPTTLANAEADLAARFGTLAGGGLMPLLSATFDALQNEQSVSATELAYRPDGTLSITFAAPAVDAINRVLVGVQRNGYRITAVPRQSPDGRAMVDTTVRATP